METKKVHLLLSYPIIASFIGSGINGNLGSTYQVATGEAIASFIGSGINGNVSAMCRVINRFIESLLL